MLQRIQTVYLLIVLILTGFILSSPFLSFSLNGELISLSPYKLFTSEGTVLKETMPMATIFHLSFVLTLLGIYFFKKRFVQMRFTVVNCVLCLGSYGLFFYYYKALSNEFDLTFQSFNWSIILPLINAILLGMAIRSIAKDEALVRSLNRIR